MSPVLRQLWIAAFSILTVLSCGAAGYAVLEGWSWFDALYMSVITVTTVGFAEIQPLSPVGRMFTIVLVLSGFGIVAYQAMQIVQLILEADFRTLLWKRKMKKAIDALNGHYIICGYGRVGEIVGQALTEKGIPVVVIDGDPVRVGQAKDKGLLVVEGNAVHDAILLGAGIRHASGLITVLNRDADNLLVSLSARELNHNIHIITRGEADDIEPKLIRAGADMVVSPYRLSGEHIADLLLVRRGERRRRCLKCSGTHVGGLQLHLVDVADRAVGRTIGDLVREEGALRAVAIYRSDVREVLSPGQTHEIISPADHEELLPLDQVVLLIHRRDGAEPAVESDKPGADPHASAIPPRKTVLVADDHDAMRNLFVKKVRAKGYHVLAARDGTEAMAIIQAEIPAAAILDVMMPGHSGYDICRTIRETEALKQIKVILFSNQDEASLRENGEECGADGVVAKSATGQELLGLLADLIGE